MIESWDVVIDKLGGTGCVATEFGLAASIVSGWRKRGIPSTRWLAICRLAETKGELISMEVLAELAAGEPAEARP